MTDQTITLEQMVRETGVFRCLECGKCTAICPISRYDHRFSPRRTVGRALMRHDEALLGDDRLWACLTCLHCSQVCPAGVAYPDLTLAVRAEARRLGAATVCTHGEAIHAWMRLMIDPTLKQDRLGWLRGSETQNSETLYFVGCAPYYGALFKPLGVDGDSIARSTLRVLNALGIEPQVLADERCCGHDLLWEGDIEGFRALAGLNAALIRESGAKRIVTACPECARALKIDYPAHGINLGIEVLHLAELLASSEFRVLSCLASNSELETPNSKLRTRHLPRPLSLGPPPGRLRRAAPGDREAGPHAGRDAQESVERAVLRHQRLDALHGRQQSHPSGPPARGTRHRGRFTGDRLHQVPDTLQVRYGGLSPGRRDWH